MSDGLTDAYRHQQEIRRRRQATGSILNFLRVTDAALLESAKRASVELELATDDATAETFLRALVAHEQSAWQKLIEIDDGFWREDMLNLSPFADCAVVDFRYRQYLSQGQPIPESRGEISGQIAWLLELLKAQPGSFVRETGSGESRRVFLAVKRPKP